MEATRKNLYKLRIITQNINKINVVNIEQNQHISPHIVSFPPLDIPLNINYNLILEPNILLGKSITYSYYSISMTDNIYRDHFIGKQHYIFNCDNDKSIFIIIAIKSCNELHGCIISEGPITEFLISHDKKKCDVRTIKKILKITFTQYKNTEQVDMIIKNKLCTFCKDYPFDVSKLDIGVVYCSHYQTDILEIFENKYHNSSKNYKVFLNYMHISDYFDPANKYDDIFNDNIKIRWYPSTHMESEEIRQYIGNTNCVIFFNDGDISDLLMNGELLKSFGKVNQIFIIVSCINNLYYIKIVHKKMDSFPPYVPYNYLFKGNDIWDFILTKVYNGAITLKINSQISEFFLTPRKLILENINNTAKII